MLFKKLFRNGNDSFWLAPLYQLWNPVTHSNSGASSTAATPALTQSISHTCGPTPAINHTCGSTPAISPSRAPPAPHSLLHCCETLSSSAPLPPGESSQSSASPPLYTLFQINDWGVLQCNTGWRWWGGRKSAVNACERRQQLTCFPAPFPWWRPPSRASTPPPSLSSRPWACGRGRYRRCRPDSWMKTQTCQRFPWKWRGKRVGGLLLLTSNHLLQLFWCHPMVTLSCVFEWFYCFTQMVLFIVVAQV